MKSMKSLSAAVVMSIMVTMGLAACGDSPTATVVPPTATVAPVATATTAAPPTVAPTATTAAALPTATAALSSLPTSTTAAGSRDATADEIQLIKDVTTGAKEYTSYHFQMQIAPSSYITQPLQAEGDYVAPNLVHATGTMGDQNFDEIVISSTLFKKDATGTYVKQAPTDTSSDPLSSFSPESLVSGGNPLGTLGNLTDSITKFKYAGDVQVQGVTTKHFTFSLDMADMMQGQDTGGMDLSGLNLGNGGLYIDANNKVIYGLEYNLDLGAILTLMARAFESIGGTPTPGGAAPTAIPPLEVDLQALFTRHNDPTIKIPVTNEMMQEANADSGTTDTPVALDTPATSDTPVAQDTPVSDATAGTSAPVTGQMGTASDIKWAKFTVNSVRREDSGNLNPSDGNEFVIVNVTIENESNADGAAVSSLLMMDLLDSTGKSLDWAPGAKANPLLDSAFQDAYKDSSLPQGKSVTGEVGYEVPKGTTGLVLHFKPDPILDDTSVLSVSLDQ